MLILLAEDSKTLAHALRKKLMAMGHEVALAEDGQAAVDWFVSGHPDLIVMDIEMPRMDGFDAVRKIRSIESKQSEGGAWTPVVFLTATDTVQNLLTAIEAGGDDFLPKTAPDQVLGAKIAAMARISSLMKNMKKLTSENKTLAKEAGTDAMTTLPNRRALEALMDELDRRDGKDSKKNLSLMMIDVDNFKKYNDANGHAAGDKCLAVVGRELARQALSLGEGAFAARYGGEEFAVILDGGSRETAMRAAWGICAAIEGAGVLHPNNGKSPVVSVSIGVSGRAPGMMSRDVIKVADTALYAAKEAGRAQAVWMQGEANEADPSS